METRTALQADRLRTIEETAAHYSVSKGWLYQNVHKRNVPYCKVGKYLRFSWDALDRLFGVEAARGIDSDKPVIG